MVTTNADYRKKLESERRSRGKRCHFCGCYVQYGEFAHKIHYSTKRKQKLKSMGRGKNSRVIDIIRNPDIYILSCHDCHKDYDHKNFFDVLYG